MLLFSYVFMHKFCARLQKVIQNIQKSAEKPLFHALLGLKNAVARFIEEIYFYKKFIQ